MNSVTKAEIKEFKGFVKDTLVKKYGMNELEAYRAVQNSYLSEALIQDKNFVEHDTVEEWADFIREEIDNCEQLMM